MSAPSRRELVRHMTARGLSERRALQVMRMSASALRYQPRPDRNQSLRERIVALVHRHRRYGAAMIYLKLRQAGEVVNHKRVERLYAARRSRLQIDSRWAALGPPTRSGRWTLYLIARLKGVSSRA